MVQKRPKIQQVFRLPKNEKEYDLVTEWLNKQSNKSASICLAISAMIEKYGMEDLGYVINRQFVSDWQGIGSVGNKVEKESEENITKKTNPIKKKKQDHPKSNDGPNPMDMLS